MTSESSSSSPKAYDGTVHGIDELTRAEMNNQNEVQSSTSLEVISTRSAADDVESFNGDAKDTKETIGTTKSEGTFAALDRTKTRLFSPKIKDQRKVVLMWWLWTVFLIACFCFTTLVLFWGVMYRTPKYVKRVEVLALIQEDPVYKVNDNTEIPSVSSPLRQILEEVGFKWTFLNATEFEDRYGVSGPEEVDARAVKLIYDEKYWAIVNVRRNATAALVESLTNPDSDLVFNSTALFQYIYESGRDLNNFPTVILDTLKNVEAVYREVYTNNYLPGIIQTLVTPENFNPDKIAAAGRIDFELFDHRPVTDIQYIIFTQIGNVYCIVMTLFVFLLMGPVHSETAKVVRSKSLWIYRLLMLWSLLFFASLFYCTVTAVYHKDFTKAFGRGGFMVYWMTTYMMMLAVGGLNENVVMLILLARPAYISLWMITFIVLNLTPSFFTIGFANVFYRYGYAMPLYNAVALNKVIFFDLSRQHMGRNYGVLAAWIGMNTIAMPFVTKFVTKTLTKRAVKAAQEAKQQ